MKQIYYNGAIITLETDFYAQAVLVCDGIISKIGEFESLWKLEPNAELIDLGGKTMLPAFIDAHSHFSSYANAQIQVPLDETASFAEICERITKFIAENQLSAGEWVVAKGYDHNTLAEKSHPTKKMLDEIAPNNPLILQHQSGHCGVLNSKALCELEITPSTPQPKGGVIGISNGKLTGYLEEDAYIGAIRRVPMADINTMLDSYRKAQRKYFSYGITTVQEGMMVSQMLPLYKALIASGLLEADVIGYSETASMAEIKAEFPNAINKYDCHFKLGGYKIFLDGSPQVKTAWMQTPYQGSADYFGYGTMTDAEVLAAVEQSATEGTQILAHCNGDAAAEQYISAIEKTAEKYPQIKSLKPVIIHAQLLATQQLPRVSRLNIIPSFFVAHVLHWGDIHIQNFGYERAKSISPAQSALNHNICFTFHQDAPVIEPNMLETIQCAATRQTKHGVSLGEDECISVLDAIKAVTINAAYQYSEQEIKGSIKEGKHADFVILNENPLKTDKNKISEIKIMQTIKDGEIKFTQEV